MKRKKGAKLVVIDIILQASEGASCKAPFHPVSMSCSIFFPLVSPSFPTPNAESPEPYMSHDLNSFKGITWGIRQGTTIGVMKGDTGNSY